MPLSLSNRDQNSGHLFYNRRLRAATTRFSARMKHDDRKQTAAIVLSMVLVAIGAGWMMLLNVLKPTGVVRADSAIIGDHRFRGDLRAHRRPTVSSAQFDFRSVGDWDGGTADVGQAGRDREVSDRAAGRHSRGTGRDGGEQGRGFGVVAVRYGRAPAQR